MFKVSAIAAGTTPRSCKFKTFVFMLSVVRRVLGAFELGAAETFRRVTW